MIVIYGASIINLANVKSLEVNNGGHILADGSPIYIGNYQEAIDLFKVIATKWAHNFAFFDIDEYLKDQK